LTTQPKYSFSKDKLKTLIPIRRTLDIGPADYMPDHKSVERKIPNGRFSKNQHTKSVAEGPGPGQYNWEKLPFAGTKSRWHKEHQRPISHKIGCTGPLGPGSYTVTQNDLCNNSRKKMGWTMRPTTNVNNTWVKPPGPGNYNPKDMSKTVRSSFPKTSRMDLFSPAGYRINNNPGPGSYEPETEKVEMNGHYDAFEVFKQNKYTK